MKTKNQGEGDRESARRYDKHVEEFVAEGEVQPAAADAEAFVEQHPAEAAAAELAGKRGPKPRAIPRAARKGTTSGR